MFQERRPGTQRELPVISPCFLFNYSHNAVMASPLLWKINPSKGKLLHQFSWRMKFWEIDDGSEKAHRRKKGWGTQSKLIFFPLSYPFLFFLSGYLTGGFINHHLDSLCQRKLTAFGPIRRCRDNRNNTSWASTPGAKHCLPVITYRKGKINPYQLPCFLPLIWGFCGVPGAWQTITDIITSALIFFFFF